MGEDAAAGRAARARGALERRREVLTMARLGLPLDLVARRVGLPGATVERLVAGAPATARAWDRARGASAEVLTRAGLVPDLTIAQAVGLSRHRVQRIRRAAGIPAWRSWPAPHGTYARWQACACVACRDARTRHEQVTYPGARGRAAATAGDGAASSRV